MGTILGTLIIGLVVGAIAKLLMPGRDPGGFLITILLGIAGAFLAGFLGRLAKRINGDSMFRLTQSSGPVSRMQALTGVVKLLVPTGDLISIRSAGSRAVPDAALIPLWGQPYLAAAVDRFEPVSTRDWGN